VRSTPKVETIGTETTGRDGCGKIFLQDNTALHWHCDIKSYHRPEPERRWDTLPPGATPGRTEVPFLRGVPFSDKEKTGRQRAPFFNSAAFYNWYRFFIIACNRQLEHRCVEWKSHFYFNKTLHVFLSALLWFVNLNLSSNRSFSVSAVRGLLQLTYRS
jgi:hypothetical protein